MASAPTKWTPSGCLGASCCCLPQWLPTGALGRLLLWMDGTLDLCYEVRRECVHAMGGTRVLGALVENFLLRLATRLKVTIDANVSAFHDQCHPVLSPCLHERKKWN